MDLKEIYNTIAEDWHKAHKLDSWWMEGTDAFLAFLPKGGLILDVGCGSGVKSKYLVDAGMKVVGIDFSDTMINIAKREVPSATFLVADMREVEKLAWEFDGIYLQAALLHIPKAEAGKILKKLLGKLRKGGHIYIAVKEQRSAGPAEEVKNESDHGYQYERFFSYYTVEELGRHLKKTGVRVVFEHVTPQPQTRWIQIIGKK